MTTTIDPDSCSQKQANKPARSLDVVVVENPKLVRSNSLHALMIFQGNSHQAIRLSTSLQFVVRLGASIRCECYDKDPKILDAASKDQRKF
jgi:hypothetical protein